MSCVSMEEDGGKKEVMTQKVCPSLRVSVPYTENKQPLKKF